MIKKIIVLIVLIFTAYMFQPLVMYFSPMSKPGIVSERYLTKGPDEVGAANIVTSVVVTYRGLDTLGEVAVLFIATAGIGFLFKRREDEKENLLSEKSEKRDASEIVKTGASFLTPLLFLFGIYIFTHGHLTPGGGFQGGVIIASAVVLVMLSDVSYKLNETVLTLVESLSGAAVVLLALFGLVLASGFMDNRFMDIGELGKLFSSGAIPLIYSLIGLKVGSELTGILKNMSQE